MKERKLSLMLASVTLALFINWVDLYGSYTKKWNACQNRLR